MYIYIAAVETEFKLLMSAAERLLNVGSWYIWPSQCLGTFLAQFVHCRNTTHF